MNEFEKLFSDMADRAMRKAMEPPPRRPTPPPGPPTRHQLFLLTLVEDWTATSVLTKALGYRYQSTVRNIFRRLLRRGWVERRQGRLPCNAVEWKKK